MNMTSMMRSDASKEISSNTERQFRAETDRKLQEISRINEASQSYSHIEEEEDSSDLYGQMLC